MPWRRRLRRSELPAPRRALLGIVACAATFTAVLPAVPAAAGEVTHHDLRVRVDVRGSRIEVVDRVRVPAGDVRFLLHRDLAIQGIDGPRGPCTWMDEAHWNPRHFWDRPPYQELDAFDVVREIAVAAADTDAAVLELTIRYAGVIADSLHAPDRAYGRGFESTSGRIVSEGAFLAGGTFWLPWFGDGLVTFDLTVETPAEWRVVSQGELAGDEATGDTRSTRWRCADPMEEVYLIAGPYQVRERETNGVRVLTYCYESTGEEITNRYLDATGPAIERFAALFGPYPYSKFALVENYWQTGFGMPSFTLLGDRVIRLPFIVDTSYPHEIAHNWWGNGVYVKREEGNWCEGLTTYCADYAAKEEEGLHAAREYRRSTLTGYRDFAATGGQDFALVRFRERDSPATQAVGYGKTMMVFHMLRDRVGDETFWSSLRHLFAEHRFRRAGWTDVQTSFEITSSASLGAWFDQWIRSPGAPSFALEHVTRERGSGGGARIRGVLVQTEPAFDVDVPIVLTRGDERKIARVPARGERTELSIDAPFVPERIAVDPDFEIFRLLHAEEVAPALSSVLGATATRIVLGESESDSIRAALEAVAHEWAADSTIAIATDADADFDGATWFFGRGAPADRFVAADVPLGSLSVDGVSVVAVGRRDGRVDRPAGVLLPHDASSVADIARKIPHYSKYSYLTFEGSRNVDKGFWAPGESPLLVEFEP